MPIDMSLLSSTASLAFDAALALVYPQPCAICGKSVESRHDGVACSRCWDDVPLFCADETLCWKCGALSLGRVSADQRATVRCGRCDDYAFTAARACGPYEGALRAAVLELKRQPHVPRRLADLIYESLRRAPFAGADLVISVPLHPSRERERGFNQARVLACALQRLNHLPLAEHVLVRQIQTTMHRAGMDALARRQSVAKAFAVRHPEAIAGKCVLLVDDVFTTGATASACSATLKDAGAARVFVLTIARAATT
jgi:ComF family protein